MDDAMNLLKKIQRNLNIAFWIAIAIIILSFICMFSVIYGIRGNSKCDDGVCPNNTEAYYTLNDECYCAVPNKNNENKAR
jgi:hypothetical protein